MAVTRMNIARLLLIFSLLTAAGLLGLPAREASAQPAGKLRIATEPLEPFILIGEDGHVSGFSAEVWQAVAEDLKLDYEWVPIESFSGLLDEVQSGQIDAAISGISMTSQREGTVDFTHPYFNSGLQIMVPTSTEISLQHLLRTVFSPALLKALLLGLLLLFGMANVFWLVEHKHKDMPKNYPEGVGVGVWWAFKMLVAQEYFTHDMPAKGIKRLFVMGGMVAGVILVAQFTAVITASLTVQQLNGTVNGPEDLPGKRVLTLQNSTGEDYLKEHHIGYETVEFIEDAFTALEAGEADAIVSDAPVLMYYAHNEGNGHVLVTGPVFENEYYGIALPSGSPLREPVNQALLRLKETGEYDEIYKRWFGEKQ